jgi:hypothetical protein
MASSSKIALSMSEGGLIKQKVDTGDEGCDERLCVLGT